jgi:hypothetical protein
VRRYRTRRRSHRVRGRRYLRSALLAPGLGLLTHQGSVDELSLDQRLLRRAGLDLPGLKPLRAPRLRLQPMDMITTLGVFCTLFSLSVDYDGALLLSRNWEECGLHRGQRLSGRARLGEDRKAGHGRRDDRALSWFPRRCVFWAAGTGRLPSRLPGSTTGSASPSTMLGKEGETLSQRGSQVLY